MPVDRERLFDWHANPGAFQRLSPPWQDLRVIEQSGGIEVGARVVCSVPLLGPLRGRWVAEHTAYQEGESFEDVQRSGPFASWVHLHSMLPAENAASNNDESMGPGDLIGAEGPQATSQPGSLSRLRDRIDYALPLGFLGRLFGGRFVRKQLKGTFSYRHRQTRMDLERHRQFAEHSGPLTIAVSGASGLLGSAVDGFLSTGGHRVIKLVRKAPKGPDEVFWNPELAPSSANASPSHAAGDSDSNAGWDLSVLEGIDAVVHLAGENIAAKRWTPEQKQKIYDSRVLGTRHLAQALAQLKQPPRALLCASAVGYYGDRPGESLSEDAQPGDGFLAETGVAWEAASEPARSAGVQVANLRFGVLMSPRGGALQRMLTPFRFGLGGPIANGREKPSGSHSFGWIALDDAVDVIHFLLSEVTAGKSVDGPWNTVAPEQHSWQSFSKTLGRVLRRPAFFAVPRFAARLAFGQMAEELFFPDQKILPQRLEAAGFTFRWPELESALRHDLGLV